MCGKGARKNSEQGELQSGLMFHSIVTSSQHGSALNYYTSHEYPGGKKDLQVMIRKLYRSGGGREKRCQKCVCVCGSWGGGMGVCRTSQCKRHRELEI